MLKKLSMAALFAACISIPAFASNDGNDEITIREVKLTEGFTKIIVSGNAEIVLIREQSMIVTIEDEAIDTKHTVIKNKNGVLEVKVTGNYNKRPVIRIPVHQLEMLEVNGNGDIRSASYLESENLAIFINGACKVALRVIGSISVESSEEFELMFHKNESVRIKQEVEQTHYPTLSVTHCVTDSGSFKK
jgi:Putative auto-transporter adhesin, head GIN domain